MPRLGGAWPNAPAHRGRCGGLGGACVVDDSSSWPAVGCQSGCRKVRVLAGCGYSFFFSFCPCPVVFCHLLLLRGALPPDLRGGVLVEFLHR